MYKSCILSSLCISSPVLFGGILLHGRFVTFLLKCVDCNTVIGEPCILVVISNLLSHPHARGRLKICNRIASGSNNMWASFTLCSLLFDHERYVWRFVDVLYVFVATNNRIIVVIVHGHVELNLKRTYSCKWRIVWAYMSERDRWENGKIHEIKVGYRCKQSC